MYQFFSEFSSQSPHNVRASGDGVQQLTLVLDGQQRLTSLLIGMRGSYTTRVRYRRWNDPNAWVRSRLYLDLLKDPAFDNEDGTDRYGFQFLQEAPENSETTHWIKVGRILDFDSEDTFYRFADAQEELLPDKDKRKLLRRNLERLYRAVWRDQVIAYYTEHDQDYDRVLDIFVRANDGGTKLSKSDLLLSMITLQWDGINAREEIHRFVDRLNNDLTRRNDFDKDFLMKTCLVLSDLKVAYKVDSFNKQNIETIRQCWQRIKTATEAAVDLINWFGIDRDTLTSANALIPVIYYLFQHPNLRLRGGSTDFDRRNAAKIRRWLTLTLLNNVFGGASDTALRDARRVLQEQAVNPTDDFPAEAIDKALANSGRTSYTDQRAVENFLSMFYGNRLTYLALSLLYDENHWGTAQAHQDHIFPRSLFNASNMAEKGIDAAKQERYIQLADSIGNLELLLPVENLEKSAKDFECWVTTRDNNFKKRHLIPDDPSLLVFDRFEEFVNAREELIRARINRLFETW